MDSNNPVVRLCSEGIRIEMDGRAGDAYMLYMQAWEARKDDFDACVAAHYIARHQTSLEETLRWNKEALDRARAANDYRVQSFYPSLYLNMGRAHEDLGYKDEARCYYELAAGSVENLPADPYGDLVRNAIEEGRKRIAS